MNRRALLAGVSVLTASRALAQPVPVGGKVGYQHLGPGPLSAVGGAAAPTLDLSFMTPGTMPGSVVFTRASTSTYFGSSGTLQTAATNAPRWNYNPSTLTLNGVLIEEARTNLILQSGDFTQAAWTKSNMTFGAGVAGPNGATTGNGCISASGSQAYAYQVFTPAVSTTYCASCFFRSGSLSLVQMIMPPQWWANAVSRFAIFDLASGIMNSVSGGGAVGLISPAGNGWYHCTLIATPDTAASAALQINRANATGDGVTIQHYAFGAQFEAGAFPTSYMPTTTVTVARAADSCSLTDAVTFGGTIARSMSIDGYAVQNSGATNCSWLSLNDGSINNLMQIFNPGAASPNIRTSITVGGVSKINGADVSTGTRPTLFKSGISNGTTWNAATNGTLGAGSGGASALLPPLSAMQIGVGGATQINGHVRRVRYWPRGLSAAELQAATT